jgi:hypothetical protein
MAEQLNLEINIDNSDSSAKLGTLKKQLREAQTEVQVLSEKFGATSKEAIEAAKRAGELKDAIGDAKALTEAFNPDAKFKALTASLSGVAGGFSAVQGAIALFGVESEQVEKTLLKVQSAMAVSQGLQSVGEAIDSFKQLGAVIKSTTAFKVIDTAVTKVATIVTRAFGIAVDTTAFSFKALKVAIASTGLGVLVVALGYVIEKMMQFSNASEEATKKQKELNEQIAEGTKQGLADNEKFIDSDTKLKLARAKLRGASEKELFDIEQQGIRDRIRLRENAYEQLLKTDGKAATQIAEQNAEANSQLELNQIEFETKQRERRLAENQKRVEEEKERIKQANKLLEESEKRRIELNKEFDKIAEGKREKEKEDAINQQKADDEEVERLFALEEEKQKAVQDTANAVILTNEQIKQSELDTFIAKKEIQLASVDLLYGLSNVLSQLAGKNKALQVAAIIAENAAGIARIIINTQVANAKAVAISPATVGQPFVAINNISAGLGIASSLLATRKALASLGGGNAGSAPQLSNGGSAPVQPSSPTAQLTQLNQSSINAIGNQAIRAYVVETDVTSNQQRITAIKQRARFN